jgi:hypothetical protein
MPRVVIELQATTQQAVQAIQQFAKAQRDAFDAIRAGNPMLAEAAIKVSTLTQAYGQLTQATQAMALQGPPAAASIQTITKAMTDARGAVVAYGTATAAQKAATSEFLDGLAAGANKAGTGLKALDKAAKDTAKGGLAALLNDVPIVGGALAKLATTLGGFPLLLGGIVGAGIGFIAFLRSVQTEATKAGAAAAELAASIENNLRKSIAAIERLRAERGGTRGAREAGPNPALLELDRVEAERAAKDARDAALRQAETQAELARGAAPGLSDVLMPGGIMARQERISRDLNTARLKAEGEYETELLRIREQFKTDAVKLEDDYDKKLDDLRDERVKKETTALEDVAEAAKQAAEKQQRLLEETTREGIDLFKKLGPEAAEALKKLEFEQWLLKAREELANLNAVIASGADIHGTYAAAAKILTEKLQEAVTLGFIPVAEEAAKATTAIEELTEETKYAADSVEALFGITGGPLLDTLNELIAAGKAAQAAVTGTAPTGRPSTRAPMADVPTVTRTGGPGPVIGGQGVGPEFQIAVERVRTGAQDLQNAFTNTQYAFSRPEFQHGGIVPGVGPMPIIAHGGERIVPVHGENGVGAVQIRIEPGAIQLSGTLIDQQRGWGSLVEELGQALEARLRRRAR